MVLQQRVAVFHLVVGVGALGFFLALWPVMGMAKAQGGFALLALTGLTPLVFRARGVQADERDRMIQLQALRVTLVMLWLMFTAGVWGLVSYYPGAVPREMVILS